MEDNTKDLSDSEKLNLILAEIADMKARIGKLETFAEDRSRETKPLLGQIQKEIIETRIEMRERFEKVDERFEKMEEQITFMREDSKYVRRTAKVMQEELFRARAEWEENREDIEKLETRVEKLEAA